MPRLTKRVPKYSVHKRSGQALVRIDGRQIPLGVANTPGSKSKYDQIIGIWLANQRRLPTNWDRQIPQTRPIALVVSQVNDVPHETTLGEVLVAYLPYARQYYAKANETGERSPTRTFEQVKQVCSLLRDSHERTPAIAFGPPELINMRVAFVRDFNWGRKHANEMTKKIVAIFQFATERLAVPPYVFQCLKTVKGLHKARPLFTFEGQVVLDHQGLPVIPREGRIPPPIDDETVNRTIEFLPTVVADMVQFQRATGARPGEVTNLRPCDIDQTQDVWLYHPHVSKTDHEDTEPRVIAIGPKAQEILKPYLTRLKDSYCFSPYESEEKRRRELGENRRTPISCGNRAGTNRRKDPKRPPSRHYKVAAYGKAIRRAVDRANAAARLGGLPEIQRRAPNQLRKSHALEIRENAELGLDHAQVALGHQQRETTEKFYARKSSNS